MEVLAQSEEIDVEADSRHVTELLKTFNKETCKAAATPRHKLDPTKKSTESILHRRWIVRDI